MVRLRKYDALGQMALLMARQGQRNRLHGHYRTKNYDHPGFDKSNGFLWRRGIPDLQLSGPGPDSDNWNPQPAVALLCSPNAAETSSAINPDNKKANPESFRDWPFARKQLLTCCQPSFRPSFGLPC